MSRILIGSINGRSSIKIAHFIRIRLQTLPLQAILVSDWLISKISLKSHGQMNRNLIESIKGRSSIKIAHFIRIPLQTWPLQAILVSDWSISKKSSLKPHGQMKRNLVGSIYGRYSIKIAHFVPIRHKYGCHRQFLFLIGQFLKKSLPLKLFDQININLVGSIYGRSSIKMLISSRSITNMATTGESCF